MKVQADTSALAILNGWWHCRAMHLQQMELSEGCAQDHTRPHRGGPDPHRGNARCRSADCWFRPLLHWGFPFLRYLVVISNCTKTIKVAYSKERLIIFVLQQPAHIWECSTPVTKYGKATS